MQSNTRAWLLSILICLICPSYGQTLPKDSIELPSSLDDRIENLLQQWYDGYELRSTAFNIPSITQPDSTKTDSIYMARLTAIPSAIRLSYNAVVKDAIELFVYRRRSLVAHMLNLADLYFPTIEEELDKLGLPLELKYLTIVESSLNPKASSRARATGLWQFMLPTARRYGLRVNSLLDERMDPIKSTQAACTLLRDLHNIYQDWWLALAAYNCGPGNVNKAIARSGGKQSFWQIYHYLPRETKRYIPLYIATYYAMYYAETYGIKKQKLADPIPTEYIEAKGGVSLSKVASLTGVPLDRVKALNPQYKRAIIPKDNPISPYLLRLPLQAATRLARYNKDLLLDHSLEPTYEKIKEADTEIQNESKIYHKVKKGETLSHIAKRYKLKLKTLQSWNKASKKSLRVGDRIIVGIKPQIANKELDRKQSETYTHRDLRPIYDEWAWAVTIKNWEDLIGEMNLSKLHLSKPLKLLVYPLEKRKDL